MDFGDILALLIYIAIPVLVSGKKKAKEAQKPSQQKRQPAQDKAQGGVVGWLESMVKELEKAAGEGRPAGVPKPVVKPAEPATQSKSYKAPAGVPVASGTPVQSQEAKSGGIPVWRVAPTAQVTPAAEEERTLKEPGRERHQTREVISAVAGQGGYALFEKDELVKGIILSEILQPPVTLRQRNKRRPF